MDEWPQGVTPVPASMAAALARWLVTVNLAVLGAGFAWFAYVDATITDGAMLVFALAVAAGLVSVLCALLSLERALAVDTGPQPAAADARRAPRGTRARRVALLFLALALTAMLTAATLTLNLKGTGSDDADTQTAAIVPA